MSTLNASFSIGSIGDVTTLLGITHALTKRLSRVDLIYEEHKALQRELQLLQILLVQVSSSARVLGMRASEDLERNLMSCKTLVNSVHVRVTEIAHSLSSKGSKSWPALFRSAGTRMFAEEEVRIYAEQLREARMKLSVALGLCAGSSSASRDSHTPVTLTSSKSQVAMCNPRTLGYPWEGGIERGKEPVCVTSATGEEILVPFEFCTSFQLLTDVMKLSIGNEPWSDMARAASFVYCSGYDDEGLAKSIHVLDGKLVTYDQAWAVITPGMRLSLTIPVVVKLCPESVDPERDWPFSFPLAGRWWVETLQHMISLERLLKRSVPRKPSYIEAHRVVCSDYSEYIREGLRAFKMTEQGRQHRYCLRCYDHWDRQVGYTELRKERTLQLDSATTGIPHDAATSQFISTFDPQRLRRDSDFGQPARNWTGARGKIRSRATNAFRHMIQDKTKDLDGHAGDEEVSRQPRYKLHNPLVIYDSIPRMVPGLARSGRIQARETTYTLHVCADSEGQRMPRHSQKLLPDDILEALEPRQGLQQNSGDLLRVLSERIGQELCDLVPRIWDARGDFAHGIESGRPGYRPRLSEYGHIPLH
ncbi:hypothetical protein GLOTRDRAFT_95291 [Gloeophyllum trabeum ATCC 11539]|uniref:Uncharacterized protein n=1 Tax=Gloeophyllum trabeum (strain ATCC 11539 / FP-39264 / Madison 617) TaxID=670483 RepID=S7RKW6_GLOTA|nr:uncharacterized protein GLOTRDRAFT_95291 [Gloeophyllum trabeum ATCC 11539]EPQ53319.1 hypothetical protein GLOTRDRAFT_95291 [Gloeophyllum trabeum ATCC 11539]